MFQFSFASESIENSKKPRVAFQEYSSARKNVVVQAEPVVFSSFTMYKRPYHDIKFYMAQHDDEISKELVSAVLDNDVVPSVYEGGFKTWECSIDLVEYLSTLSLTGNVLDLGCGSGLPGIYCQKRGCRVDFQDYNDKVLELVTIPNIMLNRIQNVEEEVELDLEVDDSAFYFGSWSDAKFPVLYDIILTSETIYELETQKDLCMVLKNFLKPGGFALIAAKNLYFGCSGTMQSFLKTLKECDPEAVIERVFVSEKGVKREIVKYYRNSLERNVE